MRTRDSWLFQARQKFINTHMFGPWVIAFLGDYLIYSGIGKWDVLLDIVEKSAYNGERLPDNLPEDAYTYYNFLVTERSSNGNFCFRSENI